MTIEKANEVLYDYNFSELLDVANAIATLLEEKGLKMSLMETFTLSNQLMQTSSMRRIANYLEPDR